MGLRHRSQSTHGVTPDTVKISKVNLPLADARTATENFGLRSLNWMLRTNPPDHIAVR
jgi:hypothetical protein